MLVITCRARRLKIAVTPILLPEPGYPFPEDDEPERCHHEILAYDV